MPKISSKKMRKTPTTTLYTPASINSTCDQPKIDDTPDVSNNIETTEKMPQLILTAAVLQKFPRYITKFEKLIRIKADQILYNFFIFLLQ